MAKSNGGSSSQVNDPNGLSLPHLIAAVITAVIGGREYGCRAHRLGRMRHRRFLAHDVLLRTEQI